MVVPHLTGFKLEGVILPRLTIIECSPVCSNTRTTSDGLVKEKSNTCWLQLLGSSNLNSQLDPLLHVQCGED